MPYRRLWPERRLEWWLASSTVFWGLVVAFVPTVLAGPSLFVVRLWADHTVWGTGAVLVGVHHLWALFINGRRRWSPYVRLSATVASALGFGLFLSGMVAALWYNIAAPHLELVLQFLFVHASICASWVAAHDSYFAFRDPLPEVPDAA